MNQFWINTVYKAFCWVKEETNPAVNTIHRIKIKITKIQKVLRRIQKMVQTQGRQKTAVVKSTNTCCSYGTVKIPVLLLNLKLSLRAMLLTSISNKPRIAASMFSSPEVWSKTKNFNEETFTFLKMWSIIKRCLRSKANRNLNRILKKWSKLMKVSIFLSGSFQIQLFRNTDKKSRKSTMATIRSFIPNFWNLAAVEQLRRLPQLSRVIGTGSKFLTMLMKSTLMLMTISKMKVKMMKTWTMIWET